MAPRRRGEAGLTLLEALVAVAILAILGSFAVSGLRASFYASRDGARETTAVLRLARTHAMSRGAHYEVVATGPDTYEVRRLELVDGDWMPVPGSARAGSLPPNARFEAWEAIALEFDTRGGLVVGGGLRRVEIRNESTGHVAAIEVWPSGQVSVAS